MTDVINQSEQTLSEVESAPHRTASKRGRWKIHLIQLAIIVVFLLLWQFLPQAPFAKGITYLDPYFISSPSDVAQTLYELMFALNGRPSIWAYAWATISASLIGLAIGAVLGGGAGLLLSNSPTLNKVLRPFLVAFNAIPRVALIPIVVILCGPTQLTSVVSSVLVVFFVIFFNAFEGGRSVPGQMTENAWILGANRLRAMRYVRFPYVVAWSAAALPNAVSFSLISVVTAEIFSGTRGMGRLLLVSASSLQANLTFAVVFSLAIVGIVFSILSNLFERSWLHWWTDGGSR